MTITKVVPYDKERHREEVFNLYNEYANWTKNAIMETYGIKYENVVG